MAPYNFSYVIDGKIAGMAHPGLAQNIEKDFLFLMENNFGGVVSLTERGLEEELLKVYELEYCHLPITDFSVPDIKQIQTMVDFVHYINKIGKAVVFHCQAGIGRTGTMLACFLVSEGKSAEDSINEVRRLRPGSIEVTTQENIIYEYAQLVLSS